MVDNHYRQTDSILINSRQPNITQVNIEPLHEKTNNVVSDRVRHKPGCKATEESWKLQTLYISRRGIVLHRSAVQLLSLCFCLCMLLVLSCSRSVLYGKDHFSDIGP